MKPSVRVLANFHSATGGGGGGTNWGNIVGQGPTPPISGVNGDFTMALSGTLNFTYDTNGGAISYQIFKNGTSLGAVASTTVVSGDTIHMRATGSPAAGNSIPGSITVAGLYSDSISVTIRNTSTP